MLSVLVLGVGLSLWPSDSTDQATLEALASSSSRPRECQALGKRRSKKRPSVWQRARVPEMVPYCDLVARAQIALETDPKKALELAEQASATWPQHAGAEVVAGRAELALGKHELARARFDAAIKLDPSALEEPRAMRAHARALSLAGDFAAALERYRALVPRASLLPEKLRVRVLLEAAFVSMAQAGRALGSKPLSADDLAEASAFAAEARSLDHAPLAADTLLALALIADRAGDTTRAEALLGDAAGLVPAEADGKGWVADPSDSFALKALLLEADKPAEAQKEWAAFQGASKVAAFVSAAKARASKLAASPKTKGKPRPR